MKFIGLDQLIDQFLIEDMPYMDMTTDLLGLIQETTAIATAKADGVIAGLEVFKAVFQRVNPKVQVDFLVEEGAHVQKGTDIIQVTGSAADLLKAERLALNLLQRISGIASQAATYAEAVAGLPVKIVDTRKTTPGLRQFEKYAVRIGGCYNHRYSLSDAVMIKDNHIQAAGGITNAVKVIAGQLGHATKIEVEVQSQEEMMEAIEAGADIVMLDNMSCADMKAAVEKAAGQVILEASGGVTLDTVREIAETGVDVISVGALTHSVMALDISLNIRL